MPLPITSDIITARLRSYPHDNYLYIGSIIKGVALAFATYALLQILPECRSEWPRLLTWITSLAAILVTYMTWGRGILVTNSRSNVGDAVFPLGMGVIEFLLFGILMADPIHPEYWLNWFALLAVHAFVAVLLVTNRLHNSILIEDFDEHLQGLGKGMEACMRSDRVGASLLMVLSLIAWVGVRWVAVPKLGVERAMWIQGAAAIPFTGILTAVIFKANKERRMIDDIVTKVERARLHNALTPLSKV